MDYLRDANVRLAVVTSVAVVKERTNLAQQAVNVLTALTPVLVTTLLLSLVRTLTYLM